MRDYLTKVDNSAPLPQGILSAEEDNVRFEEMKQAVVSAGITPDPVGGPTTDNAMLAQAMAKYASGGIFCTDAGVANAYILNLTSTFKQPKALFHGLRVGWMPGATSSGASTINAFTLGIKKLLRPDATVIQAGDVFANRYAEAWYDSSADAGVGAFRLVPWAIPVSPVSGATPLSGEGISVDGTYHVSLNYPGLSTITTMAGADLLSLYQNSSSHHKSISWTNFLAALGIAGGGLVNVQALTTPGPVTYTKTSGTTRVLLFATGGGGGGGGGSTTNYTSSGGGGGGTAIHFMNVSAIATVDCVIGAGGAGGIGNGNGSSGGTTSFSTHAVATGGGPGICGGNESQGGVGGAGTSGLVRLDGQGGSPASTVSSGTGGSSFLGGGGFGGNTPGNQPGPGGNGGRYGGGGGGGNDFSNGGSGAGGAIIILEFA